LSRTNRRSRDVSRVNDAVEWNGEAFVGWVVIDGVPTKG
jgi:hypothetical protein